MGISFDFDEPLFFGGAGVSQLVPRPYNVAIGGRPYVVDFEFTPFKREAYRHKNLELIRTQADTDHVPGEQTINPEGLWRRSQESWHHGAGQRYLDRADSDSNRFWYSKGIDCWTPWQIACLNGTAQGYVSSGTGIMLAVTSGHVWVVDGTTVGYTTSPYTVPHMSLTTNTLPTAPSSVASDGYNVWLACGASGVYTANEGALTPTQYFATGIGSGAVLGFALGRLMLGDGNKLYNITSAALPAQLNSGTYINSNFSWVGFAEGTGYIYAAGNLGSQGQVYKISITADGTTLGAPSAACPGLPKGETVNVIYGYLGFVLLGTSLGVRVATADSSGNLTIGSLISTTSPVKCFEGQGRFVWYGLTNYDAASTGLGRIDLSTVGALSNAPTTPGWASDLMYAGQGNVTGVVSWADTNGLHGYSRLYAVDGVGVVVERSNTNAATSTIQSGLITYDLSDMKYGVFIDVLPGPGSAGGTIAAYLSNDQGSFVQCGSTVTIPSSSKVEFVTPQTLSNTLEMQFTLTNSATGEYSGSTFQGMTVHRYTLRSMIAAESPLQFIIPLRLSVRELVGDVESHWAPSDELAFLELLRTNRTITTFQEGNTSWAVVVDGTDWTPDRITEDGTQMAGICVVTMTEIT